MKKSILSLAQQEEQDRTNAQYQELQKLAIATSKAMNEFSIAKSIVMEALDLDIALARDINKTFKAGIDPYPLAYNKLAHLLEGAKILINNHFDQIYSGDYSFVQAASSGYIPNPYSEFTTSMPNYTQTAMLEILSIIREKPISEIPDLQKEKIYDINFSPNIQGVKSANPLTLEPIREWRWCSKSDELGSKSYSELIVPALGYYFGGSRYDDNYATKQFKQEDCSSIVAKWAGAELPFVTQNILDILDPTKSQSTDYNKSAFSVLRPIGEDRSPLAGDIFCFPGHCGVLAQYSDPEGPVTVLSDTRLMPVWE